VATLLGAVSSDQLADGRVVSGAGGQHDLVAMAHALDGARSIIGVRSTRRRSRRTVSNIVWNYPNATVPRHLRDILVTAYGIADLRGKSDRDVVAAMIEVADAAFQPGLIRQAMRAGKVEEAFRTPPAAVNSAERIAAMLEPGRHPSAAMVLKQVAKWQPYSPSPNSAFTSPATTRKLRRGLRARREVMIFKNLSNAQLPAGPPSVP
jgi:acyl-CoA hydrolase